MPGSLFFLCLQTTTCHFTIWYFFLTLLPCQKKKSHACMPRSLPVYIMALRVISRQLERNLAQCLLFFLPFVIVAHVPRGGVTVFLSMWMASFELTTPYRKSKNITWVRLWHAVALHLTLLNEYHLVPVAERTRQVFVRVYSRSSPRPLHLANSDAIRTFWSICMEYTHENRTPSLCASNKTYVENDLEMVPCFNY